MNDTETNTQHKSYTSTVIGVLLFACWYIDSMPGDFPAKLVHFAHFAIGPGLLALGAISKDSNPIASVIGKFKDKS